MKKWIDFIMATLLIISVSMLFIIFNETTKDKNSNVASTNEEVNRIKRVGNPNERSWRTPLTPEEEAWLGDSDARNLFRHRGLDDVWQRSPTFIGADPRLEGFGESKYDKGILLSQLDNKSLEDIRAKKRQEEQKSRMTTILIIVGASALVLYLIKRSKS